MCILDLNTCAELLPEWGEMNSIQNFSNTFVVASGPFLKRYFLTCFV